MTLTATGILEVHLFGTPRLELNDTALVMPTKRALGLVAYLALEGATSREKLANLLWDELFFENPKRNLRQELYRLSHTPLAAFLEIGDVIKLDCQCNARLANEKHHLIDNDFMLRFEVPQAPNFNQWLQMQREAFSRLRLSRLETQAKALVGLPALDAWLEVLRLDGFREIAMQQILRLEAQHIGISLARERYKDFKEALKSELGLEPLPETQILAQELGLDTQPVAQMQDMRQTRVLAAAALLEQPFEAPMLFDVTGLTDFEVLESLELAASTNLLRRTETGFVLLEPHTHLSGLTMLRRRTLERQLAKRLQALAVAPEIIAFHLEKAGETSLAGAKYLEAAVLATRQNQIKAALEFYNKVLELSPLPEQKFMVLQSRILIARRLDERIWREAIRDLEREARNRSPVERMTADMQRGLWHFAKAEYDKTLKFITPHLEQDGKIGALAAYMQGIVMVKTGQISSAKTHLERALQTKNALEDTQIAELHNVLCILAVQNNQIEVAKTHSQIALKGFARTGNQMSLSRALSTAGVLEMLTGQHRAAVRMFKRSFEISQKIGDYAGQIATLLNLSKSTFETNQLEQSHAYLEQGLGLLEQHPNEDLRGSYLVNIAALERTGLHLDSAWTRVKTALELAINQGTSPKIASRSLIMADLATERHWFEKTRFYLDLTAQHITPELQADFILETAKLELYQSQPLKTLELLLNLECQNDNIEYRAALIGLAYLGLGQPLETLKYVETQTQTIYLPLLQAARIKAHAALGTLKENHFEPLPNKQSMPYMRYLLLQAFGKHQPHFKKEALKLEKILGKSPFNKPE